MQKKVINSTSDIPSWFNIENYNGIRDMELIEQLRHRRGYFDVTSKNFPPYKEELFKAIAINVIIPSNFFGDLLKKYPNHEVLNALRDEYLRTGISLPPNYQQSLTVKSLGLVSPTDLGDIAYAIPEFLNPNRSLTNLMCQIDAFDLIKPKNNKFHLTVDLSAHDEALINEFRSIIKALRQKHKISEPRKKTTKVNIQKMRAYKVLAFIDLKIYAEHNNYEIKDTVIDRMLFPMGEYGERDVREKVRPLAETVLKHGFLEGIYAVKS